MATLQSAELNSSKTQVVALILRVAKDEICQVADLATSKGLQAEVTKRRFGGALITLTLDESKDLTPQLYVFKVLIETVPKG